MLTVQYLSKGCWRSNGYAKTWLIHCHPLIHCYNMVGCLSEPITLSSFGFLDDEDFVRKWGRRKTKEIEKIKFKILMKMIKHYETFCF